MKMKGTLGCIAAMAAVGVFYSFAFCMVEDVDENIISEEYFYSEETSATTVTASETAAEEETETVSETVSETTYPSFASETTAEEPAEEPVSSSYAETEAPVTEPVQTETASAETEPDDYPRESEEELDDGSMEASEQSVYGANNYEEHAISDSDEYELDETVDANEYNDITETEFFEETTVSADVTEEFPVFDYDDVIITFYEDAEPVFDETEATVNVNAGEEASTSETFTAKIHGSAQTVNAYDLICKIVANEMSPSFSDEAIKAQAVAAYSYMKYHNVNGLTPSVLVKDNPPDRVKELVSEVWGVCCYYNGSVAQTVYMASSSGYTADAKNVWGGSVPYLKSVYCPFDVTDDPNYGDTLEVSEDRMREMLESCLGITLSGDPGNWLVITDYVDGNYVYEISVDGQKTISGRKLRENVMGHSLKSAAFDVYYSGGYFHFITYGYGHGVGMSQNGANILAKQGYSYVDILKYYFTGIEVI